ncbi:MAG: hypothetical protein K2X08_05705 [Chlamydiales bacterium]|nr:hypothetical protein [Chlamydiales bacterium]
MKIQSSEYYSQKTLVKELRACSNHLRLSHLPQEIFDLQKKIKHLEVGCKQFKKLRIQWNSLNNRTSQKIDNMKIPLISETPPKPVSPPPSLEPKKQKTPSILPYYGIILGTIGGFAQRFFQSTDLCFKDKTLAKHVFEKIPALQTINSLKQLEITQISLLAPLAPLVLQIALDVCKNKEDLELLTRIGSSLKKNITAQHKAYLCLVISAILVPILYPNGFTDGFDPSGHMMLKTLLAALTARTMAAVDHIQVSRLLPFLYGAYAVTDAALIYTTVSVCHTAAETLTGLAAGLLLSQATKSALSKFR